MTRHLFKVILYGIVCLIIFTICLSIAYKKAIAYCALVVDPATLLNVFITCRFLLGVFTHLYIESYHPQINIL